MALHIHAKIDDVMVLLMKKLSIEIPKFQLKRYVKFDLVKKGDKEAMTLKSVDKSGSPYQYVKSSTIANDDVKLGFFAHHGEPEFKFKVPKTAFKGTSCQAEMNYCP